MKMARVVELTEGGISNPCIHQPGCNYTNRPSHMAQQGNSVKLMVSFPANFFRFYDDAKHMTELGGGNSSIPG